MQMIVRQAAAPAKRPRPDSGQHRARDGRIALDCLAIVEECVADAIDVDRRSPRVWRGVARNAVRRRPVAAIRGYVDETAYRLTKALERWGEQRHRARHVARE